MPRAWTRPSFAPDSAGGSASSSPSLMATACQPRPLLPSPMTCPSAREPYGARFPELVPDAEWVTLPGVGHVPMYDDPGLVVRTVLELTASVDRHELSH